MPIAGDAPTGKTKANLARTVLAVHRWCSVIVALNFIVLCLTGLILVFHEEIDDALGVMPPVTAVTGEHITPARALAMAREANPDLTPLYLFQDPDEHPGIVYVSLAEAGERLNAKKLEIVDVHGAGRIVPGVDFENTFSAVVVRIHANLFLGVPGQFLVGAFGLAIVGSLVTGFFVYGPTMKRFFFGMIRRENSRRIVLADIHKVAGAATFGWNLVVASTGVLLCFGTMLLQVYAAGQLSVLATKLAGAPVVQDLSTVDEAIAGAEARSPGKHWQTIVLPGAELSTPRHFAFLMKGEEGIEKHAFGITLVEADRPAQVTVQALPWWLKAVFISEPLHFGNYGGLPLKLLWALFTVVTLGLSVTGVWVFFIGRRRRKGAP